MCHNRHTPVTRAQIKKLIEESASWTTDHFIGRFLGFDMFNPSFAPRQLGLVLETNTCKFAINFAEQHQQDTLESHRLQFVGNYIQNPFEKREELRLLKAQAKKTYFYILTEPIASNDALNMLMLMATRLYPYFEYISSMSYDSRDLTFGNPSRGSFYLVETYSTNVAEAEANLQKIRQETNILMAAAFCEE